MRRRTGFTSKAWQQWAGRTQEGLKKSIALFQQAIAADPNYALAYAGLADTYSVAPSYDIGISSKQAVLFADNASLKAVQLGDSLSETHASRAAALAGAWRWNEAEGEFRRALEINPNSAHAHYFYAFLVLLPQNRVQLALDEMGKALSLDPLSAIINTNYGWALMVAHRYPESLAQFQKTLQQNPDFVPGHFKMSHLYGAMGRYEDAVSEITKVPDVAGKPFTRDAKGYCSLNQAIAGSDNTSATALACASTDPEKSLRALEAGYENLDTLPEFIRGPELDPLRTNPRYIGVMQKMGLEP